MEGVGKIRPVDRGGEKGKLPKPRDVWKARRR